MRKFEFIPNLDSPSRSVCFRASTGQRTSAMEQQWKGKIAVVTGASSGIGAAIAKELCVQGMVVVGLARRLDRLIQLQNEIVAEHKDAVFHPVKCDMTKESEIETAFKYVEKSLGGVDVLINNAGGVKMMTTLEGDLADLKHTIDLNLIGVISCTKKAYKSMVDRDVPGYIINISSIMGHDYVQFSGMPPVSNVYSPTKYALTALNTVLRHELNHLKKNKIRVSNISPGLVKSEATEGMSEGFSILESKDIADVIVYMLGTDPRVQVEDVIIRPTGESF